MALWQQCVQGGGGGCEGAWLVTGRPQSRVNLHRQQLPCPSHAHVNLVAAPTLADEGARAGGPSSTRTYTFLYVFRRYRALRLPDARLNLPAIRVAADVQPSVCSKPLPPLPPSRTQGDGGGDAGDVDIVHLLQVLLDLILGPPGVGAEQEVVVRQAGGDPAHECQRHLGEVHDIGAQRHGGCCNV